MREYLHKSGLKGALRAFDQERPRTAESVTNKNLLRKSLHLDRFAAKLKRARPELGHTPCSLHLLVAQQLERAGAKDPKDPLGAKARPQRPQPVAASWGAPPAAAEPENEPAPRPKQLQAGLRVAPPPPAAAEPKGLFQRSPDQLNRHWDPAPPAKEEPPLTMEDLEDELDDLEPVALFRPASAVVSGRGRREAAKFAPLPNAREVKRLLLGGRGRLLPAAWRQGPFFNERRGLTFGLLQLEGGPCGVLAAVQAHVLLSAREELGALAPERLAWTPAQQRHFLVRGLARILWQCGGGRQAVTVKCSERSTAGMDLDVLLGSALCATHASRGAVEDALRAQLPQLMERGGHGVALAVLSMVASKGAFRAENEMDDPGAGLVGGHGYCTQDLVNLALAGDAVSNVFDGVRKLDGGTLLKGIKRRSDVGLLTLFEWYKYVEVGRNLKAPKWPIWVVCSESHFTVLFGDGEGDGGLEGGALPFDLWYYDGLAQQDAPIRLTVRESPTGGHTARCGGDSVGDRAGSEAAMVPPLEYVLETKWAGVEVDWNGSERIM